MRIVQTVVPGASAYERKSQRIDQAALSEKHEVLVLPLEEVRAGIADVAHVYASGELPSSPFAGFPLPYVSTAPLKSSRWTLRKPVPPRHVLTPLTEPPLPEAVDERYFQPRVSAQSREAKILGSFARSGVRNMVEQTLSRIQRFRSDVTWHLYDEIPSPEDLAGVDAWVDPAVEESDFDGCVAEALVFGLPIVAARTPINALRLEQGRTGWLVPPRDPNEMTHAILAALFKPEVAESKLAGSRQTNTKFRARQRTRVLVPLYETLIR